MKPEGWAIIFGEVMHCSTLQLSKLIHLINILKTSIFQIQKIQLQVSFWQDPDITEF